MTLLVSVALVIAADGEGPAQAVGAAQAPPGRVVVWVREGSLGPRRRDILGAYTLAELDKYEGIEPVPPVAAADDGACRVEETCLARLASALGTEHVLSVAVEPVHDTEVLTLKWLNLATAEVENVVSLSADASLGALTLLGEAVGRMLPDRPLDGSTPPGVTPEVTARWTAPPVPLAGFLAATGLTAAAIATTVTFGVLQIDRENQWRHLTAQPVVDGATLRAVGREAQDFATGVNVGIAVSAVLAAGTLITAWFTDFGSDDVLTPALTTYRTAAGGRR